MTIKMVCICVYFLPNAPVWASALAIESKLQTGFYTGKNCGCLLINRSKSNLPWHVPCFV